jgi:ubiquitin C-terminal hydrolase
MAGSSLTNGEKKMLKEQWGPAKNFLDGVAVSLKSKDAMVEAMQQMDPDVDADRVLQELVDYTDYLLEIVAANEMVAAPAPAPIYNNSSHFYKKPDPPEYAGLYNQGATCYMNSLLQGLFLTPELRYALYNWQYTPGRDPERAECIPYQMQRLFCQMQRMDSPNVETDSLTKSFGWAAGDQFQQQDATELLTMLTEALETCFKGTRGDGVIKALYEGVTKDYVQCRHCGYESGTKADFRTLNIAIRPFGAPAITSVEEGLANYFKPEDMTGDNQYQCEPCDAKRDADKGIRLDKVPYVLTISLLRFDYDWQQDARVKINDRVTFQETIDMAQYLSGDAEGAAEDEEEEEQGYRIKEDGGEILARGSSAVTDAEGMLYDLFAICVHAGGANGGHYYAYCKPFGPMTSSGKAKPADQWYEMNDSRVTKLSANEWQKAYGGLTKTYNRGYQVQSSTSAYMLMYRRRDASLNIDDVPDSIVPMYIFDDQKKEDERREQEVQQKAEERKRKQEEKRLREAQIPVAVWYNERMTHLLPLKTDTWGDLKMKIFEYFELPEDESELRIVVHLNRGMCFSGDIVPIEEDDDIPLDDIQALEKFSMLEVESRLGDGAWLTQVSQDATEATHVLALPTEMMMCNPDGTAKHMRWFWVDTRARTLNWAKTKRDASKREGKKAPRILTGATIDNVAQDPKGLTFETAEGDVTVVASSASVASQWVDGCRALMDDQVAVISFTDMDGEEFKHSAKLTQMSTIAEARKVIAAALDLDPDEFTIYNFERTTKVTGYRIKHLRGPGPDYALANILTAAKEISADGQPLSCDNLGAWLEAHPVGGTDHAYENTVRVWNLTKLPVQVDRLTNMGNYRPAQFKIYATLNPGYDQMVLPDKPLDMRGLTTKSMKENSSVEAKCEDQSFNVKGISWRLGVLGELGNQAPDFLEEWTIGAERKQNVFVEGFGEDEALLTSARLVFSIRKNLRFGSEVAPPGHHKVPICRFQGATDDASEHIFDMIVDENMLVRDFKMELAKKLQTDATGFPQVDGTRLRVREMPSGTFAGEVFVDDVPLIKPVTRFYGTERFAFSELEGPETKLSDKQVVLTVLKFSPSSHTLGDFIEVVVNKSSTLDSLRDQLAERDPDIAASSDVALGSPDKLITGKYLRDLAGTVWDMECLDWDWDSSTGWFQGKNNTFSLARDGDVYYYKDSGEEAMEMTEEEAEKARKRATIEKRKKQQQKAKASSAAETGVVMRVARGGDDSPPPIGDKTAPAPTGEPARPLIRPSADVVCSAVQCSAVQCSAVQCSAVQCSAVQCSAVHARPYPDLDALMDSCVLLLSR